MKKLILLAALLLLASPAHADPGDLLHINAITAPAISCTTTTSRVAYTNPNVKSVRVFNAGDEDVFVVSGNSSIEATFPTSSALAGTVIGGGKTEIFQKNPNDTHIACDASTGTNAVYVQTGSGE